jgi:hypothetical protein
MCGYFNNCEYCALEHECPYEHMGDGSPFCKKFACNVDECKRNTCISFDEEMTAYNR